MLIFRALVMFLVVAAALCFGFYAATGQQQYKRYGFIIIKWTLIAALVFFAVLFLERIV
ncbi:hypothetical protein H9K76_19645 [Diaphorobacter ruginosibacter]|uniref:Uncharacterized protein n=1 Tax=Diaphorobacter ruginosibacter TaxID=1715720 RepID=A0A7G9RM81_9BURK|nr:hypothetical protein [Diaphorobacter ruginosibacter]QNN56706.1 hypothetical protein H9K76_19645 [Diaphorobacter ruginosibacter]